MPRKTKDAPGRVTPKGGPAKRGGSGAGTGGPSTSSGRYTAPIPAEMRSSPRWYPILILALFAIGVVGIMLNYVGLLPGGASNIYLFIGLGFIVAGFVAATRWH
jgi:Cell division protein CrgA